MQAYIDGREETETPAGFVPPPNIVFASVDPMTGDVTEPWASGAIQEVFIAGTKPGTAFRR
jgi:membrane carboxypeptidase/penicillin-binding protein